MFTENQNILSRGFLCEFLSAIEEYLYFNNYNAYIMQTDPVC